MSTPGHLDRPAAAGPRPRARFRSLSHASFDPADGRPGGWQVKDVSAATDAEQRRLLESGVITRLTFPRPLSAFPGREEVAALPRRLAADPSDDGVLFSHAAAAGYDGTGRPGNVFSHVVLDLLLTDVAREGTPQRPVQMWRDPRWLTPFGHDEVLTSCTDDDAPPAYGGPLTLAACISWITDPGHYRYGTLALLLDAVAQQLEGGSPVVVVAHDVDEGMHWLAVASWFAPAVVCTRLGFCSYVRWEELVGPAAARPLSVVLREDLPSEVPLSRAFVLVDPQDEPQTVDLTGGKARRTRYGDHLPVTEWSTLAQDLCAAEPETVLRVLAQVDALCAEVGVDADVRPWWALAVAITGEESLDLSWETAQRVVLRDWPGLPLTGAAGALIDRSLRRAAASTEASWRLLEDDLRHGRPGLRERLSRVYLGLALADLAWLARPEPPPFDGSALDPCDDLQATADATAVRLAAWDGDPADGALLDLRLVDLAARAGLQFPASGPLAHLARSTAETLSNSVTGPALVERAGPADPALLKRLANGFLTLLAVSPGVPGSRVPPAVLAWAEGALPDTELRQARGLAGELLVSRALHGRATDLRVPAARAMLVSDDWLRGVHPTDRVDRTLGALTHDRPWTAVELAELVPQVVQHETVDVVPAVVRTLSQDPFSDDALLLSEAVLGQLRNAVVPTDPEHLALLRAPRTLFARPSDEPDQGAVDAVEVGLSLYGSELLAEPVRHMVGVLVLDQILLVALRSCGRGSDHRAGTAPWRESLEGRCGMLVEECWSDVLPRLLPRLSLQGMEAVLSEAAARWLLLNRPWRDEVGPVSWLLSARTSDGPPYGSLVERLLTAYWQERDRRACEDGREALIRRLALQTDDRQGRAAVHAWWDQFIPTRRLLARRT